METATKKMFVDVEERKSKRKSVFYLVCVEVEASTLGFLLFSLILHCALISTFLPLSSHHVYTGCYCHFPVV